MSVGNLVDKIINIIWKPPFIEHLLVYWCCPPPPPPTCVMSNLSFILSLYPHCIHGTPPGYSLHTTGVLNIRQCTTVHYGLCSTLEYSQYSGGYHQYTWECSEHQRDIIVTTREYHDMMSVGNLVERPFIEYLLVNSLVPSTHIRRDIPHIHHLSLQYTETTSSVFVVSASVLTIFLKSIEHPPVYSSDPSEVPMVSPGVLNAH